MQDIFQKYGQMIFKICFVYTKSKEDAEDAMQNTFLKYINKRPEFENQEHERNWLIRVAVNICKNFVISYWQRNTVGTEELNELSVSDRYYTEILIDLFKLPLNYRTALYLYYYEGYSISEIAGMLKTKESTVANRLSRARKILKMEMEENDSEEG